MQPINIMLMDEWGLTLGEGTDVEGKALIRALRKAAQVYKSRYEEGRSDERSSCAAVVAAERVRATVLQEHKQQIRPTFKVVDDSTEPTESNDNNEAAANDAGKDERSKTTASPTTGRYTLFVGGINAAVADTDIRAEMSQYGKILQLIRRKPEVAFVVFDTQMAMKLAKLTEKRWRVEEAYIDDRVTIMNAIRSGAAREVTVAGISLKLWPTQFKKVLRRAVRGLGAIHVAKQRGRHYKTWTAVVQVVGDDDKQRLEQEIHGRCDKVMGQHSTLRVIGDDNEETTKRSAQHDRGDNTTAERETPARGTQAHGTQGRAAQKRGMQGRGTQGRGGRGRRRGERGFVHQGRGRGQARKTPAQQQQHSSSTLEATSTARVASGNSDNPPTYNASEVETAISPSNEDATIDIDLTDKDVLWGEEDTTNPLEKMLHTGLDISSVEVNDDEQNDGGDGTTEREGERKRPEHSSKRTYLSQVTDAYEEGCGAKICSPNDIVMRLAAKQQLELIRMGAEAHKSELVAFVAAGQGACAYESAAWMFRVDTRKVVDGVAACLQDTERMTKLYQDIHRVNGSVLIETGADNVKEVTQQAFVKHCEEKATTIKHPTTGVRQHEQRWSADAAAWADTLTLRVLALAFGSYATLDAKWGGIRMYDENGAALERGSGGVPCTMLIFDGEGHYGAVRADAERESSISDTAMMTNSEEASPETEAAAEPDEQTGCGEDAPPTSLSSGTSALVDRTAEAASDAEPTNQAQAKRNDEADVESVVGQVMGISPVEQIQNNTEEADEQNGRVDEEDAIHATSGPTTAHTHEHGGGEVPSAQEEPDQTSISPIIHTEENDAQANTRSTATSLGEKSGSELRPEIDTGDATEVSDDSEPHQDVRAGLNQEELQACSNEEPITAGDRVMAHYRGSTSKWLPGVVVKCLKRTFKVKFDDGDEHSVKPEHIRLPQPGEGKKQILCRTRQQTAVALQGRW